jgi:hypothetical protein
VEVKVGVRVGVVVGAGGVIEVGVKVEVNGNDF